MNLLRQYCCLSAFVFLALSSVLQAEARHLVIKLDPKLHEHFSDEIKANAPRWLAVLGPTRSVEVLSLKEKPAASNAPTFILTLQIGRTWWHGQNHRQFLFKGSRERSIGGGLNLVTTTYEVVDFNVAQVMAELRYLLRFRDRKERLVTRGTLRCIHQSRNGAQLPPQLLRERAKQSMLLTVTDGLARRLNRRLQEDVARKIVVSGGLKKRAGNVVIDVVFRNVLPCDVQGQFTFKLENRTLGCPFDLKQGEHKRQEAGVVATGVRAAPAQLNGLSRRINVTLNRLQID